MIDVMEKLLDDCLWMPVRRAGSADGKRKRRIRAGRISRTTGRIRTKPSSFERGDPGGLIGMYHLFFFDI